MSRLSQSRDSRADRATILVVDDEPSVVRLLQMILSTAGYTVTSAASGSESLKILASHSSLDLAIVDLVLPDVPGEEILERAHRDRPEMPLVAMSGYGERLARPASEIHANALLAKPFEPSEVRHLAERLIRDASRSPAAANGPADAED